MLPGHLLLGNMNSCCKVQLLWLGVTIQHLHQVVILLCPRHKLLQSQLTILVNIHSFEYGFSGVKRRGISPSQASLNIKYFYGNNKAFSPSYQGCNKTSNLVEFLPFCR